MTPNRPAGARRIGWSRGGAPHYDRSSIEKFEQMIEWQRVLVFFHWYYQRRGAA